MLSDLITVAIDEAFNEEYEQFDIIDKEWTEWFSNGEKRVEVTYKSGGDSKVGKVVELGIYGLKMVTKNYHSHM